MSAKGRWENLREPRQTQSQLLPRVLPSLLLLLVLPACMPNLDPVDPEATFSHAEELVVNIGPRPSGDSGAYLARNYILNTFVEYGLTDPHFHAFSDNQANVVATVPGSLYPESIFLVGAHYDTIEGGVGSIDNATGVASLLEVARYFSRNPPAYTLRLVGFDAEELGLMGSGEYYLETREDLDNTLLMLCLDMTQTNETNPGAPLVAFVLSTHPVLAELFLQVKQQLGLAGTGFLNITPELARLVSGGGLRSDIQHWDQDPLLLAWPWALSFDYHTIPGAITQIDKTGLAISTKFILEVLRGLQEYPPEELHVQGEPSLPLPVDEGLLRILRENGGLKPLSQTSK